MESWLGTVFLFLTSVVLWAIWSINRERVDREERREKASRARRWLLTLENGRALNGWTPPHDMRDAFEHRLSNMDGKRTQTFSVIGWPVWRFTAVEGVVVVVQTGEQREKLNHSNIAIPGIRTSCRPASPASL